jgi:hypothetical protein
MIIYAFNRCKFLEHRKFEKISLTWYGGEKAQIYNLHILPQEAGAALQLTGSGSLSPANI